MRNQHLLAALLLITSMTLGSFGYAARTDNVLPVQEIYEGVSCQSTSRVYLNQDNDTDGMPDFYLYLNSNFILNYNKLYSYSAGQILREAAGTPYTTVQYYTPLPNMIYKVDSNNVAGSIDGATFWRASWVFPYNTPVRGIATTPNKVVFEQPGDNDTGKNLISIVYNYKYKYAQGFDGTIGSTYRYNQVASMDYMLNTGLNYFTTLPGPNGNRRRSWSPVQATDVCKNYELHRCGDGVINTGNNNYINIFSGEVCDDGLLNGTPGHCPKGCGNAGTSERCGDKIIQEPGTYYNGSPQTPENMSFEACDDGDNPADTNEGFTNGDDPGMYRCDLNCSPTFSEQFIEVFIDA